MKGKLKSAGPSHFRGILNFLNYRTEVKEITLKGAGYPVGKRHVRTKFMAKVRKRKTE